MFNNDNEIVEYDSLVRVTDGAYKGKILYYDDNNDDNTEAYLLYGVTQRNPEFVVPVKYLVKATVDDIHKRLYDLDKQITRITSSRNIEDNIFNRSTTHLLLERGLLLQEVLNLEKMELHETLEDLVIASIEAQDDFLDAQERNVRTAELERKGLLTMVQDVLSTVQHLFDVSNDVSSLRLTKKLEEHLSKHFNTVRELCLLSEVEFHDKVKLDDNTESLL